MRNKYDKISIKNILRFIAPNPDRDYIYREEEIAKILIYFLNQSKINQEETTNIIYERFEKYRSKLGFINSYWKLKYLVKYNFNKKKITTPLKRISGFHSKYRLFVLYSLLNFASGDNLLSIWEDEFIDKVRAKINIPKETYNKIKKAFLSKGLKDENEILEEQARKETAKEITKSFLPYNAYKILGVSPTVTKKQLKKVYRNLVKKYHLDKFYGQSEDIIQQMETKFQEITEAYEIIKRYKKHN